MSASHTPSPGQTPTGPPGTMPAFMRRRQQGTNPLVKKKLPPQKAQARPPIAGPQKNGAPGKPNGVAGVALPTGTIGAPDVQGEYVDYPVFTTKREILEGLRTHVMRFLPNSSSQVQHVDPLDETQFVRPVKLHRRDPRADPSQRWKDESGGPGEEEKEKMDEKERERLEILKAERRAEKEANQAQIAPVIKAAVVNKKNHFQKKTEQVFQVGDNPLKKKAMQLRYEEALPWHVEDFDSKNTWSGNYESALSECHAMLIPETEGGMTQFRMVPVEKWYRFTAKNLFKTLSIDEAEARMIKKNKDPRWFMDKEKETQAKLKEERLRKAGSRLFTRTGERGEKRIKSGGSDDDEEKPEVAADVDDIDYNYDEAFADDEENVLFGGDDEENKEAEEKIKREQREANIFELKEEKDYDKEEEDEKTKAQVQKKLAKKTQKALMKREKNFVYEDDSDGNPYSSDSTTSDSETERQREEERKKAEETAAQEKEKEKEKAKASSTTTTTADVPTAATKPPSAIPSTKGTSTPSRSDNKKSSTSSSSTTTKGILKRSGSPNLSEASGSESSRKKQKKKHLSSSSSSTAFDASSAGASISRPHSPISSTSTPRPTDTDASTLPRPINPLKIRLGGSGSATNSRPSSPGNSRRASPTPTSATTPAIAATQVTVLPTLEEIRARIPKEGIALNELMKPYSQAVKKHPEFIQVIKAASRFDKVSKVLYPKEVR